MADELMSGYVVYTTAPDIIAESHSGAQDQLQKSISITVSVTVSLSLSA